MSNSVSVNLSAAQRKKIIDNAAGDKTITMSIKAADMNGDYTLPVDQGMMQRYIKATENGKGMMLKLDPAAVNSPALLDKLTQSLPVKKSRGKKSGGADNIDPAAIKEAVKNRGRLKNSVREIYDDENAYDNPAEDDVDEVAEEFCRKCRCGGKKKRSAEVSSESAESEDNNCM